MKKNKRKWMQSFLACLLAMIMMVQSVLTTDMLVLAEDTQQESVEAEILASDEETLYETESVAPEPDIQYDESVNNNENTEYTDESDYNQEPDNSETLPDSEPVDYDTEFDQMPDETESNIDMETISESDSEDEIESETQLIYELEDAESGITVIFDDGIEDGSAVLNVRKIEGDELATQLLFLELNEEALLEAWDISLLDTASGQTIQPNSRVTVEINLSGELDETQISSLVYRMDPDAQTILDSNVLLRTQEDFAKISFATEHFTPFLVFDQNKIEFNTEEVLIEDPETEITAEVLQADEEPTTVDITAKVELLGDETDQSDIETYLANSSWQINLRLLRRIKGTSSYNVVSSSETGYQKVTSDLVYEWKEQPRYDDTGNEYEYVVQYVRYNYGYSSALTTVPTTYSTSTSNTNSRLPSEEDSDTSFVFQIGVRDASVTATIKWDDQSDRWGKREENAPLSEDDLILNYGDENDVRTADSLIKNEDGTYTVVWNDVPRIYDGKEAVLTIEQKSCDPDTYTTSSTGSRWNSSGIIVTNKLQGAWVRATLTNNGYNSFTKVAADTAGIEFPTEITATLTKNGTPVEGQSYTFTPQNGNSWNRTSQSYLFVVPVSELDDEDTEWGIDWGTEFDKEYFVTSETSTISSQIPVFTKFFSYPYYQTQNTSVKYDDDANSSGVRPAAGEMQLKVYANGEPFESVAEKAIPSADGTIYWNSLSLPQLDEDGEKITYTMQVENLPAYYEVEVTTNITKNGSVDINSFGLLISSLTFQLKRQTMTVDVLWEDQNLGEPSETELKNRPENLNLLLQYSDDGGETWKEYWGDSTYTIRPNSETKNKWTYSWDALPAVDAEGNEIIFRAVQQDVLSRYSTKTDEPVKKTDEDGNAHTTQRIHNAYNDNWNYAIDLYWDRTDPDEKYYIETTTTKNTSLKATYKLVINTQKTYEAGQLEVRLPYELFDARTGDRGTVFSSIGLGDENSPTQSYSYTYRIDDKGTADTSDDELVIYNYKDINGSNNIEIPVTYTIIPYNVIDTSVGTIQATAKGTYKLESGAYGAEETQTSNEIKYRLDTGVELGSFTKAVANSQAKRIYYWNTTWGEQPEDFDLTKYNYVTYYLSYRYYYSNQPSKLVFTDVPEDDGEVYRIYYDGHSASSERTFTLNEDGSATWESTLNSGGVTHSSTYGYYVVVRYPRKELEIDEEGNVIQPVYHNSATLSHIATDNPEEIPERTNDYNDIVTRNSSASIPWEDYRYVYNGQIYSFDKSMSSFSTAGITRLEYGLDIINSVSVYMRTYGYNLLGYQMDLSDDALYARAYVNGAYTDAVRLTEDDYYFSGRPTVSIEQTRVDRSNGQTISGSSENHSFTLYGRKGNEGDWEEIETFEVSKETQSVSKTLSTDISEEGYTALRVVSEEGLEDYCYVRLYSPYYLRSSSKLFQGWISEYGESMTQIRVDNFATFKLYTPETEGGEYRWFNPVTNEITLAEQFGLAELDIADPDHGDKVQRDSDYANITPVSNGSSLIKNAYISDQGPSTKKIDAHYFLAEYEYFSYNGLPDEIYSEKSQDSGVFYDLLPLGYYYNASKPVTVKGAFSSYYYYSGGSVSVYGAEAAGLVNVETIDNYKNTGRQMVIFTVESLAAPGKNWKGSSSDYRTGFYIDFYAIADYEDVTPQLTQYNIAAFQRGDGEEIFKSYDERGYGSNSNANIFILDETGERVLADPNGDGENKESSTLYAYVTQQADFMQAIETGIKKLVKANSGQYVKDDTVNINSSYSYKLSYTSSSGGTARNVVLYDILENAEGTGGYAGERGWYGTFAGTSVQSARLQGIDVKVWYSTKSGLNYNDWDDIAKSQDSQYLPEYDPDIWSDTPPADLSTVTAVAFDMRKTTTGEEKVFLAQEAVSVEIFMTAPDDLPTPQEGYITDLAYNRPSYNVAFRSTGSSTEEKHYNNSERTTLRLKKLQNIVFKKMYEDIDELDEEGNSTLKPLGGATFKLYQCTNTEEGHTHSGTPGSTSSGVCWNSTALQTVTSLSNGEVKFIDLDTGVYAVVETASRTGFITPTYRYWVFTVDASSSTDNLTGPVAYRSSNSSSYPLIEMQTDDEGNLILLNNRVVKNIYIYKYWYDGGTRDRAKKITFNLYRDNELYRSETLERTDSSYFSNGTLHTFSNLPVYDPYGVFYSYRVEEVVPEGYYTTQTDNSITINNSISNQTAYFSNYRYGELPITKKVVGETTDRSFDMELTLTASNEKNLPDGSIRAIRYSSDEDQTGTEETLTVNEEGKYLFSLKDGETLVLKELHQVDYSLREIPATGAQYTVSYENATGTVYEGGNVSRNANRIVTVINTVKPVTLSLPVKKTVEGPVPEDQKREFAINIQSTEGQTDQPLPSATTISITGSGSTAFDAITFTKTGTYTYTVTEKQETVTGYTFDKTVHTITVNVTSENGQLKAVWTDDQTAEGSAATEIAFTNIYKPEPTELHLPVQKLIHGNAVPENKNFTFTLSSDSEGAPLPTGAVEGRAVLTITGANEKNFSMTYDKTGTYTYTVAEVAGSDHGYTYSGESYQVTVTVTDEEGKLKAVWTAIRKNTGEADKTVNDKLTFTNVYTPDPVDVSLDVHKEVTGQVRPTEQTFTFTLAAITENAPMPSDGKTQITITPDKDTGDNQFASITFTQAGVYRYSITEQNDNAVGYTYAGANEVTITVTDKDGKLQTEISYKDDKDTVHKDQAAFTNHYVPEKVGVIFPVEKKLTGNERPDAKKTFTFELKSVKAETADTSITEAPMPSDAVNGVSTVTITDEGENNFGEIDFTHAGTYYYELTEKNEQSSNPGYTYDTVKRTIKVVITDVNGKLQEKWTVAVGDSEQLTEDSYEAVDAVVFTNNYSPKAAELKIPVQKMITGNDTPEDKKFTFRLSATDQEAEGAPMPDGANGDSIDLTVTGEGSTSFAMTFAKAGSYHYTLKEVAGSDTGYAYDTTLHTITVTVTDNNGELVVSYSDTVDEKLQTITETGITFTNTYTPQPTDLIVEASKNIEGDVPADQTKTFVFRLTPDTDNEDAPMPTATVNNITSATVTGEGIASFGKIHYTKAGTYTYLLSEENRGDHGYTYSNEVKTIVVTVTDKDGILSASYLVETQEDEEEADTSFTNYYTPDPITLQIPVQKIIDGTIPEEYAKKLEFTFELTPISMNNDTSLVGDVPMPTEENRIQSITVSRDELGTFENIFDTITFTAAGIYEYSLAEKKGSDTGFTYDNATHKIIVTVSDNEGRLTADWTYDGKKVVHADITNQYEPLPTYVAFDVEKTITGAARPEIGQKTFSFTLTDDAAEDENTDDVEEEDTSEGETSEDKEEGDSGVILPEQTTITVTDEGKAEFDSITFTKPGEFFFTITEKNDGAYGYTYDTSHHAKVVVEDQDGKLKATWSFTEDIENPETIAKFSNNYNPDDVDLIIPVVKEIEGANRPAEKKTFEFTLTPISKNGDTSLADTVPMPLNKDGDTDDKVIITDAGEKSFNSITFTEYGEYIYTITETEGSDKGYEYDTQIRTIKVVVTDTEGVLSLSWFVNNEEKENVTFRNKYSVTPVDQVIPVSKNIIGDPVPADNEKTFTFKLVGETETEPMPEKDEITIVGTGSAEFDPITFEAAGIYRYKLTETPGAEAGYTYDSVERVIEITVVDDDSVLKAEWTRDGEETESVEFINEYKVTPTELSIPVSKAITGDPVPADNEKTFTFKLTGETETEPMPEKDEITIVGTGNAEFDPITFETAGIYRYKLTEVAGNENGYTYDSVERVIEITVVDDDSVLKAEWTSDGEEVESVEFINEYKVTPTELSIPVSKAITGAPVPADNDKTFTFKLTGETETEPMPETDEITIVGTGSAKFDPITFEAAGIYRYKLTEVAGNENGYTYDTVEHVIEITVVDDDSVLNAEWTCDEEEVETVVFTNQYQPSAVSFELEARKKLTGKDLEKGMFSFVLSDENGKEILKAENEEDGTISFPELTFTEAGIYKYVLSEVKGNAKYMTYDEKTYTITITVTDEDGVLKAVADKTKADLVFTNVYEEPEKSKGKKSHTTTGNSKKKTERPKTGDDSTILLYVLLAGVSILILILGVMITYKKRRSSSK